MRQSEYKQRGFCSSSALLRGGKGTTNCTAKPESWEFHSHLLQHMLIDNVFCTNIMPSTVVNRTVSNYMELILQQGAGSGEQIK